MCCTWGICSQLFFMNSLKEVTVTFIDRKYFNRMLCPRAEALPLIPRAKLGLEKQQRSSLCAPSASRSCRDRLCPCQTWKSLLLRDIPGMLLQVCWVPQPAPSQGPCTAAAPVWKTRAAPRINEVVSMPGMLPASLRGWNWDGIQAESLQGTSRGSLPQQCSCACPEWGPGGDPCSPGCKSLWDTLPASSQQHPFLLWVSLSFPAVGTALSLATPHSYSPLGTDGLNCHISGQAGKKSHILCESGAMALWLLHAVMWHPGHIPPASADSWALCPWMCHGNTVPAASGKPLSSWGCWK